MTKKLLFVMTILLVASFALMAADVSGKWTFEQPGRGGNPGRPVTITLKADGTKLTGSVPGLRPRRRRRTSSHAKSPTAKWMATMSPSP